MIFKRIALSEKYPDAYLDTFVSETAAVCDGLLVIPGGGYGGVCADREGAPIAMAFAGRGVNCFVLHYTVAPHGRFPQQLIEAALAMQHIRTHAAEYHVDPARVFAVGFSAGGHLAASLGTLWHLPEVAAALPGCDLRTTVRPIGMLLCYAVITAGKFAHEGSFENLLGSQVQNPEKRELVSLEKQVTDGTCPAFLLHTTEDRTVPVENALLMAAALSAAKIPFELHIYPHGPHGIALANAMTDMGNPALNLPEAAGWVDQALVWMKNQ